MCGERSWDPFERTREELLLAESFARFDFRRPRKAQQWFMKHGVIDVAWMFPALYRPGPWPPGVHGFGDLLSDVLEQQHNVQWHLHALARLSTERQRAGSSEPRTPHQGWDPAWARVALRAPDGTVLWTGTEDPRLDGRITPEMQRYARYEDVPDRKPLTRYNLRGHTPEQFTGEWWPAAHAAWKLIERESIPVLWLPDNGLYERWPFGEDSSVQGREIVVGRRIGSDWHGLMEIERRLLRPYVRRAAAHELELIPTRPSEPLPDDEARAERWFGTLEVVEERWWRSLLAPVYLQLFEALRRISEGRQGGAFCRECGEPFLVLDARRSAFCNDRERARWSQRERRKRLSAPPAPLGMTR